MAQQELPFVIREALSFAIATDGRMMDLGFKQDRFCQLKARNCTVTLHCNGGECDIDIRLPNGNAIGFAVAVEKLTARTAFAQASSAFSKVQNCGVTLYRVGGEWEIDIGLPNGSGMSCDVPLGKLTVWPAHDMRCRRAD